MILSIIIPVYKVEKYIEKCLFSCLRQDISYKNYEIIVVNDGTPDKSISIVEQIANKYTNIRIINQENQGLSGARNTGMKYAKGEYLWFIDSDDYIEENCLKRIVSYLKDGLDILQLQYRYVYEDATSPIDIEYCRIEGIKTGLEVTKQGGLPAPAPFSVFRSRFIKDNGLAFVRGVYHEDSEFKPKVTYLAKKIASDDAVSYNYLQRTSGSITSRFKLKNGLDILKVNESLLDFTVTQNMSYKYRKFLYDHIGLNMNTLLYGYRQLLIEEKVILFDQLKKNKQFFSCMMKSSTPRYWIEGFVFHLNLKLGFILYHYIRK